MIESQKAMDDEQKLWALRVKLDMLARQFDQLITAVQDPSRRLAVAEAMRAVQKQLTEWAEGKP